MTDRTQELVDRLAAWIDVHPRDSGARELYEDTLKVLRDTERCASIHDFMLLDGVRRVEEIPRLSRLNRRFTLAPGVIVRVGWWRWLWPGARRRIKRQLAERACVGLRVRIGPWWW